MGSPRQFDRLAEAIYRRGYSAATLLLPGHGGTAKDFGASTYKQWQDHVDAEIERFSKDYPAIWLVGHSMGGALALITAVTHSDHVKGLFLIACPFKFVRFSLYAARVRLMQVLSKKNNPIKKAYLDCSSVKPSISLVWHMRKAEAELNKLVGIAKENLPNVCASVIAVYSFSDELVSVSSYDTLSSCLTGANVMQVLLSDSLHAYYTENEYIIIEQALLNMVFDHIPLMPDYKA
jgi:carboxylesterase